MAQKLTLRELAALTNTSINTVSRALNNKRGVSAATREMVVRMAEQHNYRPNLLARSMRGNNSNLLGIIVGDISNPFFVHVLEGIEEVADKESMTLAIANSSESTGKEDRNVDTFLSYQCAGLAISPVAQSHSMIQKLKDENINFVIMDRPPPEGVDCDYVCIDNEGDTFSAVEYLIACGHRQIAIINSPLSVRTEMDRNLGYRRALRKHDLAERPEYVLFAKDKEEAYHACHRMLSLPDRPSAIFVARESLGLGVIAAIMDKGLSTPGDISVVMYGDPEWASIFMPAITCMNRPIKEMGMIAAQIIIEKAKNRSPNKKAAGSQRITLSSRLIIRKSVKTVMPHPGTP